MAPKRVTSVDRAVQLLAVVDEFGTDGLGVSELARRTGLPKSTVFRLVTTLEENGAVERHEDGYRTGPLFGTNLAIPSNSLVARLQVVLTPFLASLYEATRQTCQLGVLDRDEILFLNKLHGIHRAHSPSRIGGRQPVHCTSLGKALLAFDRAAAERVCSRPLPALTTRTITDGETLRVELTGSRVRGSGSTTARRSKGGQRRLGRHGRVGAAVASLAVTGPAGAVLGVGNEQVVLEVCARASKALAAVGDADADDLVAHPARSEGPLRGSRVVSRLLAALVAPRPAPRATRWHVSSRGGLPS
ncbi:IclR family transcriptional regulator [Janibacter melonis]|uniref:IclR family transcriptional regulator n=1 Tax=Janibacter melonis TaxID=262209 RepID=UPI002095A0F5|nr:helix-turn-helix domain-containing protein [Janibacter melonis]